MTQLLTQVLPSESELETAIRQGITWGVILIVALLFAIVVLRAFLYLAPPSEVMIFSGLKRRMPDGSYRSFRPVVGGFGIRIPFFEKVDRMSLQLQEIPIAIRNAYSKGGIPLNVDAIANVKISSNEAILSNAIERFLGRDMSEIRRVAKETLEGHLRGVLATLTPEEVNEDRLAFAEALAKESEEDLRKLGLHVDTVKIQHVADDIHYLDSTGRAAIASVIKEAEIAESNFRRAAEQAEAEQKGRSEVVKNNVAANVAKMKNELRTLQANLESEVHSEEEITKASAREARASAEQELQRVRADLAEIQQQADVVLPAEADRQAREYQARGQAAIIRERGQAVSASLDLMQAAWKEAGPTAVQIALIEDIEKLIGAAAEGVRKVKVENLQMIDGASGQMLPGYVNAYGDMLGAVFENLNRTTGFDIPGLIRGDVTTEEESR